MVRARFAIQSERVWMIDRAAICAERLMPKRGSSFGVFFGFLMGLRRIRTSLWPGKFCVARTGTKAAFKSRSNGDWSSVKRGWRREMDVAWWGPRCGGGGRGLAGTGWAGEEHSGPARLGHNQAAHWRWSLVPLGRVWRSFKARAGAEGGHRDWFNARFELSTNWCRSTHYAAHFYVLLSRLRWLLRRFVWLPVGGFSVGCSGFEFWVLFLRLVCTRFWGRGGRVLGS